ncbi:MAG TPA: 2Fe-2S iron-sulfur cluster-binding protein, partial [Chloroflexota bacterium]|nr:2Fe-2S iron-sulfur cluster-binding protein [Chloroflexota bacterium]
MTFLPDRAEAWVQPGSTLLAAASQARVAIDAPCGDRGICGKCRVRVTQGPLKPPTLPERSLMSQEELAEGWRLACQARLSGDATVHLPIRTLKTAVMPISQVELRPNVRKHSLTLPEATIHEPTADAARLRAALSERVPGLRLPLGPVRQLAAALKSSRQITAVVAGDSLISVEPGDTTARCYGIAVDLGTTSVVVALADLTTGQVIGIESLLNGQTNFGADVISRIHAAMDGELEALQSAAVATVNSALASLLQGAGIEARDVYE